MLSLHSGERHAAPALRLPEKLGLGENEDSLRRTVSGFIVTGEVSITKSDKITPTLLKLKAKIFCKNQITQNTLQRLLELGSSSFHEATEEGN